MAAVHTLVCDSCGVVIKTGDDTAIGWLGVFTGWREGAAIVKPPQEAEPFHYHATCFAAVEAAPKGKVN